MEFQLQGIGVSPGIAIAPAYTFSHNLYDIPTYAVQDIEIELARLDKAIDATRSDLMKIYAQTVDVAGKKHAEIFRAHLMILDDAALRDDLVFHLTSERVNVESILRSLSEKYVKILETIEDTRFKERAADLLDVVDRILRHLLDTDQPTLRHLDHECIVVAKDLSPSDTASMDVSKARGLIIESGSVTSHSAILARALEIPAIVGVPNAFHSIMTGIPVIMDGASGRIIVDPTPETIARYSRAKESLAAKQARLLRKGAQGPATTTDGVQIDLCANIELPFEIEHSLRANAQGIGLYRTEYLFLNRDTVPDEEEQYEAYSYVTKAFAPLPVTLRTIDIGGDKFISHLQMFKEENPQLGWRAVRFCLARPDIFKTQLRAMLRASVWGTIRIMFPMISGIEELRQVIAIVKEVKSELREKGIAFKEDTPMGSMIEVPSAVAVADLIADECDFFSLGTNDLIQYLLAVDRVNEKIAHMYQPAHPAVLRMIHTAVNAANRVKIPCSICGEMAGDPLYTELLVGLGITSFSMAPLAIPVIRAEISYVSYAEAHQLAQHVLQLRTSSEIKNIILQRHQQRVEKYEDVFDAEFEGVK